MGLKIEEIAATFGNVKQIGIVGQELAEKVMEVYSITKSITSEFEQEREEQDQFMQNFAAFAGEDGLVYAGQLYAILKEMETKLESLG